MFRKSLHLMIIVLLCAGLGIAFMATAYGVGVDDSGASVTVAKVVYTGVAQIEFQTVAYAVGEAQIADFFAMFGG